MQWCAMREAEYFWHVRRRLQDRTRKSPVQVKFHHIERSILEAVLCRGDRRVAEAIELAWRAGARMDAWGEHFDHRRWFEALDRAGVDVAALAHRPLSPGASLPWSHIRCRREESFLLRESRRMRRELGEPAGVPLRL
jgi:hypothetical protein